ncbi:class I SAM-dependent methyltransferase [Streptomyces sp. NPDC048751]|uniref:class I SAM-dependent methyltransferase n=1 Tax=Streptomyces sp. NPDC048751 TaxID=3365591 RepID=UPI003720AF19
MLDQERAWDDLLFKGVAEHYERGRLPYADGLAGVLADELGLDGTGTLADLGCGPGTLARPLAAHFARVVAVDPDPDMIERGRELAAAAGITTITWLTRQAEDVSFDDGELDAAVFAQSFHWMDRARVADHLRRALRTGGHLVHIADVKTERREDGGIPRTEIDALVREFLGEVRRAGRHLLPQGTPGGEEAVLARAGFVGPRRIVVKGKGTLHRTVDDVVAEQYSMSFSAPHLFGEALPEFDARLRALLARHAVDGGFEVGLPSTDVRVWTNPPQP